MGDCKTEQVCYICGGAADRTCDKCDEYICDDCQAKYNQFTQIDYDCCIKCGDF